ncbi:hypothetical protein K402DRAFT_338951 [Aulographum hederae CBS 113979]|uniref:C2H2-type domain-containing protein n=1 Tax=Aulographum hederae CBS 113979 TaxID=1176131 RepID=A0A6G1GQF9_9PEZI|nr:hypothetical protein K402DRAFT_338951 [Aulographum hederae CBS 113979]
MSSTRTQTKTALHYGHQAYAESFVSGCVSTLAPRSINEWTPLQPEPAKSTRRAGGSKAAQHDQPSASPFDDASPFDSAEPERASPQNRREAQPKDTPKRKRTVGEESFPLPGDPDWEPHHGYPWPNKHSKGPFRCPFPDCHFTFTKWRHLMRHKVTDDQHECCEIHQRDFDDWDTFVRHKAESIKHISCPFCGIDFGCQGGLKLHLQRDHPRKQTIKCSGCDHIFAEGAAMIDHIERGMCGGISADMLVSHRMHKTVVANFLNDPENNADRRVISEDGGVGLGGGVSLLDSWDRTDLPAPLRPANAVNTEAPAPKQNRYAWDVSEAVPAGPKPSEGAQQIKSAWHLPEAKKADPKPATDEPTPFEATQQPRSSGPKLPAWGSGQAGSSKLFPSAKATPVNNVWADELSRQHRTQATPNGFNLAYYDPTQSGYDATRFWDADRQMYKCPIVPCFEEAQYHGTPADLAYHIKQGHAYMTRNACPTCFKEFKTLASLIGHVETTRKCGVKSSKKFEETFDRLTGGFLKAKQDFREDVALPERVKRDRHGNIVTAEGDDEEVAQTGVRKTGLFSMKVEGSQPVGWERVDWGGEVGGRRVRVEKKY